MKSIEVPLPPPVVMLTKQDAVAQELITKSRTLNKEQALVTAYTICKLAKELGYDPFLFLALIRIESNYNHMAISPVGAEGLMQIMPYTAIWMAKKLDIEWPDRHSFDPVLNVKLGINYLVLMNKKFKDISYALTAYNRGPDNTQHILDNNEGDLPPHINEFYSGKVMRHLARLEEKYGDISPF